VVGCDLRGTPTGESNLGRSIGRWGLRAPGERITSLGTTDTPQILDGTSVAAPFVTGAVALIWSAVPAARAVDVRNAITRCGGQSPTNLVPPLLDAWGAYHALATASTRRRAS